MRILVQDLFGLERGGLTPAATRSARRRPNPEDAPVISHLFMTVRGPYIASAARWPLTGEAPDERLRLPLDSMPGRWRRRSRRPGRGPRCRRCRPARPHARADRCDRHPAWLPRGEWLVKYRRMTFLSDPGRTEVASWSHQSCDQLAADLASVP